MSSAWLQFIISRVINFYMGLLTESFNDVFAFSTFFYTKLLVIVMKQLVVGTNETMSLQRDCYYFPYIKQIVHTGA